MQSEQKISASPPLPPALLCTPELTEAWGGMGMHGKCFGHFYKVTHFVHDDKKYIEEVGIYENSEASKYLLKSGIN